MPSISRRFWTRDEEQVLRNLLESGETASAIAEQLGKTQGAIYQKIRRLGLGVVVTRNSLTMTSIQLPPELPSSEEALKMLAGALQAATKPGLDKVEVDRLHVVASLARNYDHMLANYIRYRQIETHLTELEHKYALLAQRTKDNAPTRDNGQVAQPSAQ